jgi:hypothetical protein
MSGDEQEAMNERRGSRLVRITSGFVLTGLLLPQSAMAAGAEPAKGAPLGQVVGGTLAATVATALVIWTAMAHRSGRITWLSRLGAVAERTSGLPAWAALPAMVAGTSQLIAVFGYYWDVAKHIDTGRDPGPFGTPAHYPILIGLFGVALAGFLAIAMGAPKQVPTSVRITAGWRAPLGGLLIFLCGGIALLGFPLDDIWHRLFGQDVTLWGPTHVQMIAGASLTTIAVWVLLVEGRRHRLWATGGPRREPLWLRLRGPTLAGAFMLGLSTLQAEFDYGVPQFQLLYHPILIALAASIGLVAARISLGRGGAASAVAFYLVIRGLLSVIIGPVFGMSTLHFPLYVAEALLVELAGWLAATRRPQVMGALSGGLIGSVGLAAEWAWSHVWMPLPWPGSLLPQAAVLSLVAAVGGGILGGFIGRALVSQAHEHEPAPSWLLPAAAIACVACLAYPLPMNAGGPATASIRLADQAPPPQRAVNATIRLNPADATTHSQWLTMTAWQGGGLVVDRLDRIAPGIYRTTEPIPVYGQWKAMLRLENGRGVRAVPVYLPEDAAIPAKAVAATTEFTRPFVADKSILQRESVGGSRWLTLPAYGVLLAIAIAWLTALGWGLRRLELKSVDGAGAVDEANAISPRLQPTLTR